MPNDTAAPPKKTLCREDLRARILRGDLAPGAELDETRLAGDYGLSRTPLREVFRALAGQGYLSLQSNRGTRVAALDTEVLRGLFQAAPLILAGTARLAAQNRTAGQIAALKSVQRALAQAIAAEDAPRAALEDHGFHTLVGEMAGNAYLAQALDRMLVDLTRLGQGLYRPETKKARKLLKKALQQHEALIVAIESQDPEEAVAVALAHWSLSQDEITRALTPDPVPHDIAPVPQV
ncbi:GntR family transcriptional regulator [Maliponia aquimaris]|uniref:HTH-type transcriptional repressor CsiR n=1 Tax=Maliponia aquimaris TaxID=1673631 RepID=A0A238JS10_9RHOB|nr:GntR family transcriptional regulator [Maliponia aquimaris]SMX33243.1 HTH-type transcriptional repressor CsiR [Maliponia aquimaris]